jgi:hypothetical protein
MDLTFTDELDFYKITGKTFIWKEQIKALGGKWNPQQKAWRVPNTTDISELKAAVLKKEIDICSRLFLESEKRPYWLCCNKAVILDEEHKLSTCKACAEGSNTYRVRGAIYTGD